jgi:hypothetical protein
VVYPNDELEEVNRENVAFLNLGNDGKYSFIFAEEIQCPQVDGPELTADGLELEGVRGGMFINVQPGGYRLRVSRNGTEISVSLRITHSATINTFDRLIRI